MEKRNCDIIVGELSYYNEVYRQGNPEISDKEYDALVDELFKLDPNHPFFGEVGQKNLDESRKVELPIVMASMDKLKSIEDIKNWIRIKNIPLQSKFVITPKFDGLSLCVKEKSGWASTRGDGKVGQRSDDHLKLVNNQFKTKDDVITFGEVIMSNKNFLKHANEFANSRNMVAGLMNNKKPGKALSDCDYIRYGMEDKSGNFSTKSELLDYLNSNQDIKVDYVVVGFDELSEQLFSDLYKKWSVDYIIDGLIIEVNDMELQSKLGREKSSQNPIFSKAYKSIEFEEIVETEVLGITWGISKNNLLKPILNVRPVSVSGVTISNCTGNNARFVLEMGLGVGSIIKLIRSGGVIPLVYGVVKKVEFVLPVIEGSEVIWNTNGVELMISCDNEESSIKKIISFFEILEADQLGEGIIRSLWKNGYTTIKDILNLTKEDLKKLDKFGDRKATIVFNSIQKSITGITLSKAQHSSGIFVNLGSKKLALLEHFKEKPTLGEVMAIEGFAEISAQSYLDGYDKFFEFIKDLPIKIEEKVEVIKSGNDLEGMTFVFTGVRRSDLESILVGRSAKIGGSVSKNTTHLIMKEKGSGSSKEVKALELGIKIFNIEELEEFLK